MKPRPETLRSLGDRLCCVALAATALAALGSIGWLLWQLPMPR